MPLARWPTRSDRGCRRSEIAEGSGAGPTDPRTAPRRRGHLRDNFADPGRKRGARWRPQLDKKTNAAAILLRDPALVLLGFALGRRGLELARIDLEHTEWMPEVTGVPKFVGDPLCPVAALARWVHYAEITAGAVFVTLSPVGGKGGKRIAPLDISPGLRRSRPKPGCLAPLVPQNIPFSGTQDIALHERKKRRWKRVRIGCEPSGNPGRASRGPNSRRPPPALGGS